MTHYHYKQDRVHEIHEQIKNRKRTMYLSLFSLIGLAIMNVLNESLTSTNASMVVYVAVTVLVLFVLIMNYVEMAVLRSKYSLLQRHVVSEHQG